LRDLGYEPALSLPGRLAKQIYKALDGHPSVLSKPQLLGLFEHMNGGRVKADGTPIEDDKSTAQERDLTVGEVRGHFKRFAHGGSTFEFLLSEEVFKLGLRIQCPTCSRRSWFPLDRVRDSFECPKCLSGFSAIGHVEESSWSYKTAGPFSVPRYAEGAFVVLLTLLCFDDRKLTTMRISPALSFMATRGKERLEADFALFWQESLYGERREGIAFGECKSYGRFDKRDYDRMRYLAKTFPGAVLVFSTLRPSLTPGEIKAISRIAKAGRKYWKAERPINPVLVLTGTELFSFESAPHCWADATRKEFPHLNGMLDLCDATQQIYLKLPSWHSDWHAQWDKKRERSSASGQTPPGNPSPDPAQNSPS
jgi:hypothetical protein